MAHSLTRILRSVLVVCFVISVGGCTAYINAVSEVARGWNEKLAGPSVKGWTGLENPGVDADRPMITKFFHLNMGPLRINGRPAPNLQSDVWVNRIEMDGINLMVIRRKNGNPKDLSTYFKSIIGKDKVVRDSTGFMNDGTPYYFSLIGANNGDIPIITSTQFGYAYAMMQVEPTVLTKRAPSNKSENFYLLSEKDMVAYLHGLKFPIKK